MTPYSPIAASSSPRVRSSSSTSCRVAAQPVTVQARRPSIGHRTIVSLEPLRRAGSCFTSTVRNTANIATDAPIPMPMMVIAVTKNPGVRRKPRMASRASARTCPNHWRRPARRAREGSCCVNCASRNPNTRVSPGQGYGYHIAPRQDRNRRPAHVRVGAVALTRVMASLLLGVRTTDVMTF